MNFRFFTTLIVAVVLSLVAVGFASADIVEFSFDGDGVDDFFFTIASDDTPENVSLSEIRFEDITVTSGGVTQSDATVVFGFLDFGDLVILRPGNDNLTFLGPLLVSGDPNAPTFLEGEFPLEGELEGFEVGFLPVGALTVVNTSVPEPGVLTLMLGWGFFLSTRRRRSLNYR